jgi:phage/plasmid-associated DNA primase
MTTAALNSPKDYAYYYRDKMEVSVIPLKNPEHRYDNDLEKEKTEGVKERKQPAVQQGHPYFDRKPTDAELEQWFAINQNYNLAIPMGQVSGCIAFDIDGQQATDRVYSKISEMSSTLREALANTMKNRTGSGGEHIVFRVEGDISDLTKKELWTGKVGHSQILMIANRTYIVVAPSRHPKGELYQWNGKHPQTITRQELDEFIRLVGNEKLLRESRSSIHDLPQDRRLTVDSMEALLKWIMPVYKDGSRDHFLFYLSGAMRKGGFSHEDTLMLVDELSNRSPYPDEDSTKNELIVDRRYRDSIDKIRGKAGLKDLLVDSYQAQDENEHQLRVETFSRICQIINPAPDSPEVEQEQQQQEERPLGADDEEEGEEQEHSDYHDRPGQWLRRQLAADKNLSVIETICNEVLRLERFKTFADTKEIRWYNEGTYLPDGENRITSLVEQLGGYGTAITVENEILRHIRRRTIISRDKFDTDAYLVNCRNCVVDLRTGLTYPHDPDKFLFTQQIPWDYKPDECNKVPRKILHFWYNIMPPPTVKDVLEYVGYCLIGNCNLQKAMILAGPPSQGKSKLLDLIRALLGGQANVSNKTMHQLNSDRFSRAHLYGKLANICADISDKRLSDIETFKLLVTGDWIDGEFKGQDSFTFPNKSKLIFSANLPPLPPVESEDDGAFYRRWTPKSVSLRKTCFYHKNASRGRKDKDCPICKGNLERDPDLLEKLIADEDEMSGLLFLAVQAARFLLVNKRFSYNPDTETVREDYLRKAKPVKAWADACCEFSDSYQEGVDKHTIYTHFVEYCNRKGLPAVELSILGRELGRPEYGVTDAKVGPKRDRKHVWKGIMLRRDLRARGQLGLDEPEELDDDYFY